MAMLFKLNLIAICLFFSTITLANELVIEPNQGFAPIQQLITESNHIDLVIYGFTDKNALLSLIMAKKQNKSLQILMEKNPYRAANENLNVIRILKRENIPLQFSSKQFKLTHQKTFIFDHKQALVMTFNLTRSAFKTQRNFAILDDEPNEVKEIAAVFAADWQRKPYQLTQNNLVWSPDNSRAKIRALIQKAQANIYIYAESITDYQIIGELAKAARRGVNVKILTSLRKTEAPNHKFEFLQKQGVEIYFSRKLYIHAKAMMIDHKLAMVGSINLTKPSLDENRELAVITNEPKIIHQLEACFNQDLTAPNMTTYAVMNKIPFLIAKGIRALKLKRSHHKAAIPRKLRRKKHNFVMGKMKDIPA